MLTIFSSLETSLRYIKCNLFCNFPVKITQAYEEEKAKQPKVYEVK